MSPNVRPVDVIHLGPQKSGTTWLYRCLKEHPQVACAPRDSIHYYDMFYHKGPQWYAAHFVDAQPNQLLFDTTPSYIRSIRAPERIYRHNQQVKLALTLRHPIDRAFSHFWHERKNPDHRFEFDEVLSNYDFFASWLEPGFYAEHIERYQDYFQNDQFLFQTFDQLQSDARSFWKEFLEFVGVDSDFTPSWIDTRINEAKVVRTSIGKIRVKAREAFSRVFGKEFRGSSVAQWMTTSREYGRGPEAELYNRLLEICLPEIEQTEELVKMDLSHWKAFL